MFGKQRQPGMKQKLLRGTGRFLKKRGNQLIRQGGGGGLVQKAGQFVAKGGAGKIISAATGPGGAIALQVGGKLAKAGAGAIGVNFAKYYDLHAILWGSTQRWKIATTNGIAADAT